MRLLFLIVLLLTSVLSTDHAFAKQLDNSISPTDASVDNFDQEFADDFSDGEEIALISDPLEGINRGVFWFNDKLYFYLLKPVARTYRVVPRPARKAIKNIFSNLSSPVRIVNSLLQFKVADASRETTRFLVNTTVGLGGMFDVVGRWGKVPKKDEDFGQTLGVYHVGQGPYIILPFLGPSSLRDAGGLVVDVFLDPFTSYLTRNWTFVEKAEFRAGLAVNQLSLDDDSYEKIKRDSLDPYLFMRAAYAQYRLAKVAK